MDSDTSCPRIGLTASRGVPRICADQLPAAMIDRIGADLTGVGREHGRRLRRSMRARDVATRRAGDRAHPGLDERHGPT